MVGVASGAIGGVVFAQGRGGSYLSERPKAIARATAAADVARVGFGQAVGAWANADDQTRRQWALIASRVYRKDRLGILKLYSGRALFLEQVAWRAAVGLSIDTTPPTTPERLTFAAGTVTYAAGLLVASFSKPAGAPGAYFSVYACRGGSTAGFRRMTWRLVAARSWTAGIMNLGTTRLHDAMGVPQLGEWMGFRVKVLFDGALVSEFVEARWRVL